MPCLPTETETSLLEKRYRDTFKSVKKEGRGVTKWDTLKPNKNPNPAKVGGLASSTRESLRLANKVYFDSTALPLVI